MRPFSRHVLKRFELYLALGAAVFVGVVYWMFHAHTNTGFTVAITVAGMGMIQAAIQWADRERSAHLRQRQIHEIREMLRDQVLNQLSAVKMWAAEPPDVARADVFVEEVNASVDAIARLIDQLSERQLDTWKLTYANAADNIAMTDAPLDAQPTMRGAVPGTTVRTASTPRGAVPDVDRLIREVDALTDDGVDERRAPDMGTMLVRADPSPREVGPTVAVWH